MPRDFVPCLYHGARTVDYASQMLDGACVPGIGVRSRASSMHTRESRMLP